LNEQVLVDQAGYIWSADQPLLFKILDQFLQVVSGGAFMDEGE
jgi:hypothetical protein